VRWAADHDHHQRVTDLMFYVGGPLGELGYSRDKLALGEAAVQAARRVGDRARAAWHTIYDVGWTHIQRGELETAKTITERGLTEAQAVHYPEAVCIALRNLAVIELLLDSPDTAIDHIARAVATAEQEGLQSCLALAKATLGEARLALGEADEACRLFEEVLPLHEDTRDASMQSITLSKIARATLVRGEPDQASRCLERAMACAKGIPDPSRAAALALAVQGTLYRELGRLEEARESLEMSLDTYARLGQVLKVKEIQRQLDEIAQLASHKEGSGKTG